MNAIDFDKYSLDVESHATDQDNIETTSVTDKIFQQLLKASAKSCKVKATNEAGSASSSRSGSISNTTASDVSHAIAG